MKSPLPQEAPPVRLQRSRRKGSRLISPNGLPVICVTRPGKWGNPFSVHYRIKAMGMNEQRAKEDAQNRIRHAFKAGIEAGKKVAADRLSALIRNQID